jgi:hypothetical protein
MSQEEDRIFRGILKKQNEATGREEQSRGDCPDSARIKTYEARNQRKELEDLTQLAVAEIFSGPNRERPYTIVDVNDWR